jgi:hypothetical protein
MASPLDGSSAGLVDNEDQDTIELELSAEQVLALSQASVAEQPSPHSAPPKHELSSTAKPDKKVRDRIALAVIVVVALSLVSAMVYLTTPPEAPAPVVETLAAEQPLPEAPRLPPADEEEPVRLKNPFDAKEVFEFPPGTSKAEARDAVAALLLQRARERRHPSARH